MIALRALALLALLLAGCRGPATVDGGILGKAAFDRHQRARGEVRVAGVGVRHSAPKEWARAIA